MKVIWSFLFLGMCLYPRLVWSGKDCVDCVHKEDAFKELNDLSKIGHRVICDKPLEDVCYIISYFDDYDDMMGFFKRCSPELDIYEVAKKVKCKSRRFPDKPKQKLLQLLVSDRAVASEMFGLIARKFRKSGRVKEFQSLLNEKDDLGYTFLDYTVDSRNSKQSDFPADMRGVQGMACKYGAVYNHYPHPEDCKIHPSLQ